MSLRSEWDAIAARIGGLVEASHVYLASLAPSRDDPYNTADRSVIPEACSVFQEIERFHERHQSSVPPPAATTLESFLSEGRQHFLPKAVAGFHGVKALVPRLCAVRSAVDYHLHDFTVMARRITERAFVHLQRSIVADPATRAKWEKAFDQGEPACERLGAAHLLLHGVWAFKAYSPGERTDLILGEPISDLAEVEATADALVLTEWKRVTSPNKQQAVADHARQQTSRYAGGSLAGIELAAYRYIVLVSRPRLAPLSDIEVSGVVYRHMNVAVSPEPPARG